MSFLYASFLWLLLPLFTYLFTRKTKQNFSQNLRWTVLALLVLSMARPVVLQSIGEEKVQAQSLVIALDLSLSMNAKDLEPSRALASREVINQFLDANSKDQISLIGFTINPLLLSPPTTDHALLKIALDNMNTEYILTKGTSLKKLLEKVAAFKENEKKLILFSDGGDELIGNEVFEFVKEENIKILALGMGTVRGSSLERKDGTLVQDKEGHIVVSKINSSLERLAKESGGEFVLFESVKSTVSNIESWLAEQKNDNEVLSRSSKQYFELSFIPMLLALILFFVSLTKFSSKLVVILLFLGINVEAEELLTKNDWGVEIKSETAKKHQANIALLDGYYLHKAYANYDKKEYRQSLENLKKVDEKSLATQHLLAHSYYRLGKYKQAKAILKSIKTTDVKLKQQIYYELGNCEAKMAYMEKARNYYVKSLQLGVDDDTLHNLNFVIFKENDESFKVGANSGTEAQRVKNTKSAEMEVEEKEGSSKNSESLGGSGGAGSKVSKNSTVKVVKSENNREEKSKRTLSSKAYDLINKGYINEEKPW